jgi:Fe-S cluster biogenesis protein NfuA
MATRAGKKSGRNSGTELVAQPHGGAIRRGSQKGNTPGTGRPKEIVRERMLALGVEKGIPFLSDVLDGKVRMQLVGVCASCKAETYMDDSWKEELEAAVKASIDQRLKAVEQTWKYGLGTQKDVDVSVSSIRERVRETLDTIQRIAPADLAARLITALQPVWT